MPRSVQQIEELLNQPIKSDNYIATLWDRNLANYHNQFLKYLWQGIKTNPQLKKLLVNAIPSDAWQKLAYSPTDASINEIKNSIIQIQAVPQLRSISGVDYSVNNFLSNYDSLEQSLRSKVHVAPKTSQQKIFEIQTRLNLPQTGVWDYETNKGVLTWLKANGWSKYITKDNRFLGTLDDLLRMVSIELASAGDENQPTKIASRIGNRLNKIKKIFS